MFGREDWDLNIKNGFDKSVLRIWQERSDKKFLDMIEVQHRGMPRCKVKKA
jgi:hypothetical protein